MRLQEKLNWIVALALVGLATTASARQGAAGNAAPANGAPSGAAPAASGQIGFSGAPRLTPGEQLAQAETMVAQMKQAATNTRVLLEMARKERDVIKILCLNDKLSQLDAAVRTAGERGKALQAASARSDADMASHEFTILSVLKQRADQTSAEAGQCVGKDDATVVGGQGTVSTTIDPGILANPTGDSTRFPEIDAPLPSASDPPPAVSGFR